MPYVGKPLPLTLIVEKMRKKFSAALIVNPLLFFIQLTDPSQEMDQLSRNGRLWRCPYGHTQWKIILWDISRFVPNEVFVSQSKIQENLRAAEGVETPIANNGNRTFETSHWKHIGHTGRHGSFNKAFCRHCKYILRNENVVTLHMRPQACMTEKD